MYRYGRPITMIDLELTTNCNLRCPQCARTDGENINPYLVHHELTLEQVQKLLPVEDLKSLSKIVACGTYGEPAITKDALKIFKYFRNSNPDLSLQIVTNGSLRNEAWWTELATVLGSNSYGTFDIDGLEDTHGIYRRDSVWEKLMKNIKAFRSVHGPKLFISTLIFKHNEHQIDDIVALARELGAYQITLRYTRRPVRDSTPWLKLSDKVPVIHASGGKITCIAQHDSSIYLGADGIFYPCCFIGGSVYTMDTVRREEVNAKTHEELMETPLHPNLKTCKIFCSESANGTPLHRTQFNQTITFPENA